MSAGIYNFTQGEYENNAIEQGAVWDRTFIYQDSNGDLVDLTGYEAAMEIRQNIDDPEPLIRLTTQAGTIIITALEGKVRILVPSTVTEDLDFISGVYDLKLIPPDAGNDERFLQGEVELSKRVTE